MLRKYVIVYPCQLILLRRQMSTRIKLEKDKEWTMEGRQKDTYID